MSMNEQIYHIEDGILTNNQPIVTISSYLEHVKFLSDYWKVDTLWFRGVAKASYGLVPSIYRDELWDYWQYDSDKANELFDGFILRAKSYFSQIRRDYSDWEWYHLMQHYGLPTRLLDWTEGSLIGLYFALRELSNAQIPTVWVLDPFWLNDVSIGSAIILYTDQQRQDPIDQKANQYLRDGKDLPELPLCIIPPYIDDRLRVQKSCFTVHGRERNGLILLCSKKENGHLARLQFADNEIDTLKEIIIKAGISESILFPDLEGLARELKHEFGFYNLPHEKKPREEKAGMPPRAASGSDKDVKASA